MNCDFIARWYRWIEYIGFGRALERRRFAFLAHVADAKRVLVLGEGDGRFLTKLVEQNNALSPPLRDGVRIDYVDVSGKMLELARGRAGTSCVRYHHADALAMPLTAAEYDLIVSHFFLDCLAEDDAAELVEKLAVAAQPEARWLISEFREPSWWAHAIVSGLYYFFRIATGLKTRRLIDHHPLLVRHGFRLMKEERGWRGLLASELWARST